MKKIELSFGTIAVVLFGIIGLTGSSQAKSSEERFNGMRYMGSSGDWISVSLEGYGDVECPAVYAKGWGKVIVRNEVPKFRNFAYGGECFFSLNGTLTVRLLNWKGEELQVLGQRELKGWKTYQQETFPIDFEKLGPGAYVVTAELPPHVWADRVYNPDNTGDGVTGMQSLYGRNAMRLAVFKDIPPARMFGVGNGMINHGTLWTGIPPTTSLAAAKLLSPAGTKGLNAFANAVLGCPGHDTIIFDESADKSVPDLCNPLRNVIDV